MPETFWAFLGSASDAVALRLAAFDFAIVVASED